MGCSDHTPTSWLPCPIGELKKCRSEWQSEEASFCNNGLVFLLCGGLCNYEIIKTAALGGNCHVEQKDSALLISPWQLQSISYGFIGILYSSRLILLYSNHLEARQTIENHLLHMGTNSCWSMHIMTSSVAILVHFFCSFYFCRSRSIQENSAPSENFLLCAIDKIKHLKSMNGQPVSVYELNSNHESCDSSFIKIEGL